MDTAQLHARLGELFLHAVRLDGHARGAYVDDVCGSDAALREQLEAMLRHHLTPAVDLERPAADVRSLMHLESTAPERIGRYRIVRMIGQGGMAIVYLAEQSQPRREVAIKLIRPGCFSQAMVRRFEMEVETLGRLRNPAIAQILEAGTARLADGTPVPYFAMEYVAGQPMLEFARDEGLDLPARLRIMLSICAGVEAAHRQGVIHRDLKPGNVLVARDASTGDPMPKIVDFGVARSIDPAGDGVIHTMEGQLVGTLPYMSPEQVAGDSSAIDTRSDVYALGVIAFELVAGVSPYASEPRTLTDWARVITTERPRRLSDVAPGASADLATVLEQALAKGPADRYQSAAALGEDIANVLAGEPIAARRDSMITSMRRHVRRYRWAIAASVGVALLLGAFAAHAKWQSDRLLALAESEQLARATADVSAIEARDARTAEEGARRRAESDAHRATAVTEYMLETLGMADPDVSRAADASVRRMLDASAASVDRLRGQPDVEASVRAVLGRAYYALGAPGPARDHLLRALRLKQREGSPDPRELYEILWPYHFVVDELAELSWGDPEAQVGQLGREIVAARDADAGAALRDLHAAAVATGDRRPGDGTFARALEAYVTAVGRAFPRGDPDRVLAADQLFLVSRRLLRRDGAPRAALCLEASLETYRSELPETNSRVVRALDLLIAARIDSGDHAAAEALARSAIDIVSARLPPDHWYIAVQRMQLGAALAGQGELDEALELVRASCDRLRAAFGEGDGYTVRGLKQLCAIAESAADEAAIREARRDLARALSVSMSPARFDWVAVVDESDPLHAAIVDLRAAVRDGRDGEGLRSAIEGLLRLRRESCPDHDPRAGVLADLCTYWGETAMNAGADASIVRALFEEAVRFDAVAPIRHERKRAHPQYWLAMLALESGDAVAAERHARAAVEILAGWGDERLAFDAVASSVRGAALCRLGQVDEGAALLRASFAEIAEYEGVSGGNVLNMTEWLVEAMDAAGREEELVQALELYLDAAETDRVTNLPRRFGLLVAVHGGLSPATVRRTSERFSPLVEGGTPVPIRAAVSAVLLARMDRFAESEAVQPAEPTGALELGLAALRAALAGEVAVATAWLDEARLEASPSESPRVRATLAAATDAIEAAEARAGGARSR